MYIRWYLTEILIYVSWWIMMLNIFHVFIDHLRIFCGKMSIQILHFPIFSFPIFFYCHKIYIKFTISIIFKCTVQWYWGFPSDSAGKESACNAGDLRLIPGLERSPGEGKGCPLQHSGLENSMDCIIHRVTKSWIQLSDFHFHFSVMLNKFKVLRNHHHHPQFFLSLPTKQ